MLGMAHIDQRLRLGEARLLMLLSHEILNFRQGFKGDLHRTYVLSHYGSCWFGFDIVDEEPTLGVPEELFPDFLRARLVSVQGIRDKGGLFLIIANESRQIFALKIQMRSSRVNAILGFERLVFRAMDSGGTLLPLSVESRFNLPVQTTESLDWERLNLAVD